MTPGATRRRSETDLADVAGGLDLFAKKASQNPSYAIAWSLLQLTRSVKDLATELNHLGAGEAPRMDAAEYLAKQINEGLVGLAAAVSQAIAAAGLLVGGAKTPGG